MDRFSATLMDHFTSPRNVGRLERPDRRGVAGTPYQGPFLLLDLAVEDGVVTAARYQTYGCGPAIACGSLLTELVVGKPLAAAGALSAEDLIAAMGGLPADKRHCADLAVAALRDALKDDGPPAQS